MSQEKSKQPWLRLKKHSHEEYNDFLSFHQCRATLAIVQRLLSLSILIHLHGNSIWALHLRGKRGYAVVPTMLSICGLCCFSEALKQVCNHCVTLLPSHCYANNNKTFAFTSFHHSIWGGNCARISIHTWNDMPFSLGILVRKWSNSSFLPQMFPL